MKKAGRSEASFEICLCSRCAATFYHSQTRKIRRVDPIQVYKEMCDICRTRRGYDFIITPKYRK